MITTCHCSWESACTLALILVWTMAFDQFSLEPVYCRSNSRKGGAQRLKEVFHAVSGDGESGNGKARVVSELRPE